MEEQQIPKPAKILGILTIIFTALGLLSTIPGLFALLFFQTMTSEAMTLSLFPSGHPFAPIRGAFALNLVITVVGLAANGVGLAGGIRLLKRKSRAVTLMNVYAAVAIAIAVLQYVGSFLFAGQIAESAQMMAGEELGPAFSESMRSVAVGMSAFLSLFGLFFASAFPVIVLIILNRPAIRSFYRTPE